MNRQELQIVTAVMRRDTETPEPEKRYQAEVPYILPYQAVLEELKSIIRLNFDKDLLIFPGGTFYFKDYNPEAILSRFKADLSGFLKENRSDLVLAFGFDCEQDETTGMARHEMGIALDRSGILALARKFYPLDKTEERILYRAQDYMAKEQEYSRIFNVKDRKFYLSVCYDCFGPVHKNLQNPGVDAAVNLVHNFTRRSGYVDYARKGFAGLSKAWAIPVFASARFLNMNIPPKWPSGLFNGVPEKSTLYFKYADNTLSPLRTPVVIETELGQVRLSEYRLRKDSVNNESTGK